MGFNNWARFQCQAQPSLGGRDRSAYSFQNFMLDQAHAMVDTGLAAAGYRTMVVDDCWMERDVDGELHGITRWGSHRSPSLQPGFDDDLSTYVAKLHAMGLKAGLYNTAGTTTCQRVAAGEEGHQAHDAARFAAWGVDFLKLDNCGASDNDLPGLFQKMSNALDMATRGAGHPILFDESAPAQYAPTDPAKYRTMRWVRGLGQMWRVAPDIRITHIGADGRSLYDPWSFNDAEQGYEEGVYQSYTDTIALSRYVALGNWNDADQLLIGDNGLTTAEERSQMSLWSIMGAPLILSADVRRMAAERDDPHFAAALAILTNRRVIAIDQDPLGAGGYRVLRTSSADDVGVDIALKPLLDGGVAVTILNKGPVAIDYSLPFFRLGFGQTACAVRAINLWSGETTILDARGEIRGRIGSHDTMMVRLAPARCAAWVPSGQITGAQSTFASPPLCLTAGESDGVTVESCSNASGQQWRMERDKTIALTDGGGCLTAKAAGRVTVTPCRPATPGQRFGYRLDGNLDPETGGCLAVTTTKVGNGGLIGQQGAVVRTEACRPFAPEQIFSAPHIGSPAVS
jgi:alpha-galactosidase